MRKRVLFKDEEVAREIELLIEKEGLEAGEKLPSERDLAIQYGVQRNTVRSSLDILIRKGLVNKNPRKGCFVAEKREQIHLNDFMSIKRLIETIGHASTIKPITFEEIRADEFLSQKSAIPEGTDCYMITRSRLIDGVPATLEKSYVAKENMPDLEGKPDDMSIMAETLRKKYDIYLERTEQRITQASAGVEEAELLEVEVDEPLLRCEGVIYDRKGRLIEYFDNLLRIEMLEFCVEGTF
jgi:GntR family transcriptional regulator